MSSRKTTNLKLHAWEPTDQFTREEFNENFAAIDTNAGNARKETETQIAAAAATASSAAAEAKSAAAAAQQSANAAAASASNAQQTANTANQAAQTAQSTADGRARIAIGSYVGTGTADITSEANARVFEVGFPAKVIFITTNHGLNGKTDGLSYAVNLTNGDFPPWISATREMDLVRFTAMDHKGYYYEEKVFFIWTDTTVKIYMASGAPFGVDSKPREQGCLNLSGVRYYWLAIG